MTYDLIIIGGGPAGTTAGIYAARQRLKTLLITKDFGGQIARKAGSIENYPGFKNISGQELINKFEDHLKTQEIDIEKGLVKKIEKKENFLVKTKTDKEFSAKAVIVCSGASPCPLNVPGEKKFINHGVSYCSLCDGPMFRNKVVAVIGGGNSGFDTATFLANYVKKIYILERGSMVMAEKVAQETVKKIKKVEIITNAALKSIQGNTFVDSIVYQTKGLDKILKVDGVFVEIGSLPAISFVKDLVDFNQRDEIKINIDNCETKTPGLFAAGDVTEIKNKQIVIAAGQGAKAAISAYNYLQK